MKNVIKYGDIGKRFIADIIDRILMALLAWLMFLLGDAIGYLYAAAIGAILALLYYVMLEGGGWHATIGKRVMGLYIAYEDGVGISYSTAMLRLICTNLSGLVLGVGYIMCLFNDEKQCLHDMIAKTYVLDGCAEELHIRGDGTYPELVAISGPLAGSIYEIEEKGVLIGRDSASCQVVLPDSQSRVSRVHCHLTFNSISGMFILKDRGSTHGTFLKNGVRIQPSKPVAIKSGERFYLATPDVLFEVR